MPYIIVPAAKIELTNFEMRVFEALQKIQQESSSDLLELNDNDFAEMIGANFNYVRNALTKLKQASLISVQRKTKFGRKISLAKNYKIGPSSPLPDSWIEEEKFKLQESVGP